MDPGMLGFWPFGPGGIGTGEIIVIGIVALLVFGRRLPDVARSLGKSIVEFKKGLKDVGRDIEEQTRLEPPQNRRIEPPSPAAPIEAKKDQSTADV